MSEFLDAVNELLEDAFFYTELIRGDAKEIRACIELSDTGESVTIILGDEAKVLGGVVNPDFKITMTSQIFKDSLRGKADPFALSARARAGQVRPVEFEFYRRNEETIEAFKAFLTYFFIPKKIKVKGLSLELAGQAHGAHPIPLVYWNGLRSGWFLVKAGETLNPEGEREPWPQMFIILKGKGRAVIRDNELNVKPNTVIYIPKNSVHQIIAEQDIELIWMSWQAKR
jgi:mannose-6-phosphate isomerase-like protein (cupin superfamily)/putative sterol carrier protein